MTRIKKKNKLGIKLDNKYDLNFKLKSTGAKTQACEQSMDLRRKERD